MSHPSEEARPILPQALTTISARTQQGTSAQSWLTGPALKEGTRTARSSARSLSLALATMTQMETFNTMLMSLLTDSSLQASHWSSGTTISDLSALSHLSPSQKVELPSISLVRVSMTLPSRGSSSPAAVAKGRSLPTGTEREDA